MLRASNVPPHPPQQTKHPPSWELGGRETRTAYKGVAKIVKNPLELGSSYLGDKICKGPKSGIGDKSN